MRTVTLTLTKEQWASLYAALRSSGEFINDQDLMDLSDIVRAQYQKTYPGELKAYICH